MAGKRLRRVVRPLGIVVLLAAGCALSGPYVAPGVEPAPAIAPDEIDTTLLLIGDAGLTERVDEPVMAALTAEASLAPGRTVVVFLGDNIYPSGVPAPSDPNYERSVSRLRAQVEAVVASGARGIFVPGNHDHRAGVDGVQRAAWIIDEAGDGRVIAAPCPGRPGPQMFEEGQRLCLAVIDSGLWFEDDDPAALADAVEALRRVGDPTGYRHVVVAGHHPIATHGIHGGFFAWQAHLFPLLELDDWLYLPLPVLGSVYVLARNLGVADADLSHSSYERFVADMEEAIAESRPLVFAAGHEHALQVLARADGTHLVVSGAGSIDRPQPVSTGADTVLASPSAGFVRLDFLHDGRVRLEVIEVDKAARTTRLPALWLEPRD